MVFRTFAVTDNFLPLYTKPEEAKCFLCFGQTVNPEPSGSPEGEGAWKAHCYAPFHGHQITFFDVKPQTEEIYVAQ